MMKLLFIVFLFFCSGVLSQNSSYTSTRSIVGYNVFSLSSSLGSLSLSNWMLNKQEYGNIDPYTVPIFSSAILFGAVESVLYMSIDNYQPSIINLGVAILASTITMVIKNRYDKNNKSKLKL